MAQKAQNRSISLFASVSSHQRLLRLSTSVDLSRSSPASISTISSHKSLPESLARIWYLQFEHSSKIQTDFEEEIEALLREERLSDWSLSRKKEREMNSSSPANSSISTTATVGGGGGSSNAALSTDEFYFPSDLISIQDRKDEAMLVIKADLMAALNKEVKSLDDDNWMFEGPVSRINLISRKGGFLQKRTEISNVKNLPPTK
ncbi:hypothetical protein F8388_016980 [Cannabis sativa]|uniref:Uncharacterized protein n=2 Tax=Cannabis sativa TaxID=3483 RepID=A0A7J6E3Y4_CANSA|nr:hypothetical protein F8388_016980 [Cannabis sativa]